MPPKLKRVIPILRMFDVGKAREFYVDYLSFSVDFEHRFNDNAPLFMGVSRGTLSLFLSEHHGDGSPGAHVVIEMTDVEGLQRELVAKSYRYLNTEIRTQEWGARELSVIDPFGNQLTFSERLAQ